MKKLIQQFMKFGVVGITAFIVEYVCLILLTELALPALFSGMSENRCALIASPIAYCVSTVYNYIFSMKYVFAKREDASRTQIFLIFVVLSLIALGLNQLLMTLFVDKLGIYYLIAKIISTMIVTIYNFISRKLFIEEHHHTDGSPQ